jgi:hypothetical protein
MPSIAPVITTSNPMVSITSDNVTYQQILSSLGTFVYGVEFIYLSAQTFSQISVPFNYFHFDSNGNQMQTYLPFNVDPYQKSPSKYYNTNSEEIVLDGFSSLTFPLEPNSVLYLKTFVEVKSNSLSLDEITPNAFTDLENQQGFKFFDDFCNYLIDN